MTKLWDWFKGLPWKLVLAAYLLMGLVLAFLVRGEMVVTDWLILFVYTFIVVIFVWSKTKK